MLTQATSHGEPHGHSICGIRTAQIPCPRNSNLLIRPLALVDVHVLRVNDVALALAPAGRCSCAVGSGAGRCAPARACGSPCLCAGAIQPFVNPLRRPLASSSVGPHAIGAAVAARLFSAADECLKTL